MACLRSHSACAYQTWTSTAETAPHPRFPIEARKPCGCPRGSSCSRAVWKRCRIPGRIPIREVHYMRGDPHGPWGAPDYHSSVLAQTTPSQREPAHRMTNLLLSGVVATAHRINAPIARSVPRLVVVPERSHFDRDILPKGLGDVSWAFEGGARCRSTT